jgi:integrase
MTKVSLRKKAMTKGRHSLYLDFYPPIPHPKTKKPTRRQFLGLFVFDKPKNPPEKDHNKKILDLAEHVRSQRQVEVARENYNFLIAEKHSEDFFAYIRRYIKRFEGSTLESYNTTMRYLEAYTKKDKLPVSSVNEKFCNGFREFLLKTNGVKRTDIKLSRNSAASIFTRFRTVLKQAYRDEILEFNVVDKVRQIRTTDVNREYLTIEELQLLANNECVMPALKRAALFSAMTGLRYSDIEKLTWDEVRHGESEGYYLRFRQKKTNGVEQLPISEQAYSLLGERDKPEERVFVGLKYSNDQNHILRYWIASAGIKKKLSFHCFRHTFATLQLTLGTDIYTVSKMLGHRDLATTQIYAKIVDSKKREAADKIKLDL